MLALSSPALYQQQGLATLPSEFQGACFSGDVATIQRFLLGTSATTAGAAAAGAAAAGAAATGAAAAGADASAATDGAAAVSALMLMFNYSTTLSFGLMPSISYVYTVLLVVVPTTT
jgi:hypothetical protein